MDTLVIGIGKRYRSDDGAGPALLEQLGAKKLAQQLPRDVSFQSTHAFGVAEALALARVPDQLPAGLILYAIEGKNFAAGVSLSDKVASAIQEVVRQLERDLT